MLVVFLNRQIALLYLLVVAAKITIFIEISIKKENFLRKNSFSMSDFPLSSVYRV